MPRALQSEDADSDMSDAEGRGSVSEDESSMRHAARSKRLPGKCDSPDTQDSSEAVSHGGSKAGRGALLCRGDKKGSGVWREQACFGGNDGRGSPVAVLLGNLNIGRRLPWQARCQLTCGQLICMT